ncbi:hypothetical protein IHQ68_02115 [Chelatococcus sambhunathii]|uniref:Uncharacterized protein n=1 Tax=Chelatococcus sambhunathii TaxID=363953 RepID=A0ABU1DBH0_9HYPH|nr:hypothetical protein [Chelatococcus sambhunathii]
MKLMELKHDRRPRRSGRTGILSLARWARRPVSTIHTVTPTPTVEGPTRGDMAERRLVALDQG